MGRGHAAFVCNLGLSRSELVAGISDAWSSGTPIEMGRLPVERMRALWGSKFGLSECDVQSDSIARVRFPRNSIDNRAPASLVDSIEARREAARICWNRDHRFAMMAQIQGTLNSGSHTRDESKADTA
jgi:hypothetical protein